MPSNGGLLSHSKEVFIAPGLASLSRLIKQELRAHNLDQPSFSQNNIVKWIAQQSILDFGSNKGRFFTKSLNNLGNNNTDAIFFNSSSIHDKNSYHFGLKKWSEIVPKSKRIATGVLTGDVFNELPIDLVNMRINDYDEFFELSWSKLTDNAIMVVDSLCLEEHHFLHSANRLKFHYKKSRYIIISKIDQQTIFQEIAKELETNYLKSLQTDLNNVFVNKNLWLHTSTI